MKTAQAEYQIDLDAYFDRLGYTGPTDCSLQTLSALQLRHQQIITFENLDPFLNRPVNIDLPAIEQKLVFSERGGYCYEQNLLFAHVLQRLGFTVSNLIARVQWGAKDDEITPRSHMLLHVRIDHRPFIVDVGFGGNSIPTPIVLNRENPQQTQYGLYRCLLIDGEYWLQLGTDQEWRSMYRFELTRQEPVDYIPVNYFTSTHNSSHFRHSIIAARIFQNGRYTLLNNQLTKRYRDGQMHKTILESAQETQDALLEVFGVQVPDPELFASRWQEISQSWEKDPRSAPRQSPEQVAQQA